MIGFGFGFDSHWLKNWLESFKPIIKRSNCNHVLTYDSHLKTALNRIINLYYMANPVLGKSLCSDWFFLGQDFAVWTVSMETVQSVYFCFGAKPAN